MGRIFRITFTKKTIDVESRSMAAGSTWRDIRLGHLHNHIADVKQVLLGEEFPVNLRKAERERYKALKEKLGIGGGRRKRTS